MIRFVYRVTSVETSGAGILVKLTGPRETSLLVRTASGGTDDLHEIQFRCGIHEQPRIGDEYELTFSGLGKTAEPG